MTGGQQRRPSFDMTKDDTAFLSHELGTIDPAQQRQDLTMSERQDKSTIDFRSECKSFFELAGVSTLISLSFVTSPLLTASYIGRNFPTVYLSAFTIANLTGNLSTFALMAGLMSASDTLSPQAYGKEQYDEVGRIAIRGFCACTALLLPINMILFFNLESIMIHHLGQDSEASMYAQQWYRIFSFSLPFAILYNCIWKFLTAQHIMKPLIVVSTTSTCIILPICLQFFIKNMGFLGSAVAYVVFQMVQTLLLILYIMWKHPHDSRTWPVTYHNIIDYGKSSLQLNPMKEFLYLGFGGVVAQCEWIFWEAVGLVVGQLGVVQLSVHTIPNQTIMTFCMVPFSFGIALAIRMGVSLPVSVRRTKLIVIATTIFSTILFGIVSIGVYVYRKYIIALFSDDVDVEQLAEIIWTKVALFNINVALFAILAGVATGLGQQWTLGIINFVFLWIIGLPIIYYKAIILHGGLDDVWFWMNVPYLGMNITLAMLFIYSDWYAIQKQIINEGRSKNDGDDNDNDEAEILASLVIEDKIEDEKTNLLNDKIMVTIY